MGFVVGALVAAITIAPLAGCAGGQQEDSTAQASIAAQDTSGLVVEGLSIERDQSGGVYLGITIDDFNGKGFAFGDGLDVVFSNGYELADIPYYNGYYTGVGDPLVVGYLGSTSVKVTFNYEGNLWDLAGFSEGDTATVSLNERGEYLSTQEALNISYSNDRDDYQSDEVFANFRIARGGALADGVLYRSASPVDNTYGRVPYASDLAEQAGIAYILNLSDSPEEVDEDIALCEGQGVDVSFFTQKLDAGQVAMINLSASYPSQEFATSLAEGLVNLISHDGPYLVHCVEGKDRTGFVCMLLEALCGATYDEMLTDYMITYDNYYGITPESDPSKYEQISELNLDGMLAFLAGVDDDVDLSAIDYVQPARDYLRSAGMTEEQIDALVVRLTAV